MKYIKYFLILTLSLLALNSCSIGKSKYQKQVKEELTEYLYSIETATTGPRFETNYEYAEEVIEEYSLKTKKKSHVETNINDGIEVLDKIILPKEKSDEILTVVYYPQTDFLDLPYGYVLGVFGDAVVYWFEGGLDQPYKYTILDFNFYNDYSFGICVYYNGLEICLNNPYIDPTEYQMLFDKKILIKKDVEFMLELYISWYNLLAKRLGFDSTYQEMVESIKKENPEL